MVRGAVYTVTIGICGGSGSGKSTISDLLRSYNILPINTDNIYRELTSSKTPCIDALISEFGKEIVNGDFSLNRKKLAGIVFSDSHKHKRLNEIAHFYVLSEVRKIIEKAKAEGYFAALVDAPLLFESGFDSECNFIIAVTADEDLRISRIVKRDNISKEDAKMRIKSQLSDEFIASRADYVINNDGDTASLNVLLESIVSDIKNKLK